MSSKDFDGKPNEKMKAWLKQAEQGDGNAMWEIGDSYYYGSNGVTKDNSKATEWFLRGANECDNGVCKCKLDYMYSLGQSVRTASAAPKTNDRSAQVIRAEREKQEQAKREQERLQKEKQQQERLQREQAEQERLKKQEEQEKARLQKEKAEQERLNKQEKELLQQQREQLQREEQKCEREQEEHKQRVEQQRQAMQEREAKLAAERKELEDLKREREAKLKAERKELEDMKKAFEAAKIAKSEPPKSFDLEIPASELVMANKLGEGTFGIVYKGEWHGTTVAIKQLRDHVVDESVLSEFRKELDILIKIRHPNIVLLMGACTDPANLVIVTEFMAGGSLYTVLRKHPLDDILKRKIALDVAQGISFLHAKNVVHRDLKSLNVLMDFSYNAKICDFGLSKVTDNSVVSQNQVGTTAWMAPELLADAEHDRSVDVYAYGIVLWELFTGQIPWDKKKPAQVIHAVVYKSERPIIPDGVSAAVADLIRACWAQDPAARPTFQQVLATLKSWA